ncbi:MAG: 1-acyl-sn-glycerol-3-phosphate acyltransferase [Rubellimicrobium sp.]|nr:1-acyl-sn-glycerol-3-phosphate acyltransferase [Rubellimicrobium sp.]
MALADIMRRPAAVVMAVAIRIFARMVTAVRGLWLGADPGSPATRLYFANHVSNGDFILIWTVLPASLRDRVRPVAAADYWTRSALRRFVAEHVFHALLIDRGPEARESDPVSYMARVLGAGTSLIIFPEGKRNMTDEPLLPFRSGIYRVAVQVPGAELVPVWIENLNRVLPKGAVVPVPLMCSVSFGTPLQVRAGESSEAFLERARAALIALRPAREGS